MVEVSSKNHLRIKTMPVFLFWTYLDAGPSRKTTLIISDLKTVRTTAISELSKIRQYLCNLDPKSSEADQEKLVGSSYFDVLRGDGDALIWEDKQCQLM